MSRLQIRVEPNLRERITAHATNQGLNLSEYVVAAISEKLDRDVDRANQIGLSQESRDWFFNVLDDTSPLPEAWNVARESAKAIER